MSTEMESKGETNRNSEMDLANARCFIEHQFPVAKVSTESLAERRSNQSQSITSLGKWWGRKPLVLVRATILGLLLPVTDDPTADREIFLKLMTMDEEGLRRRKDQSIPSERLLAYLSSAPEYLRARFTEAGESKDQFQLKRLSSQERNELQGLAFESMSHSEKMDYCCRPEQIVGPSEGAWNAINAHLKTTASSLGELVKQLSLRRYGHVVRVGDAFSGAGSIPFESARLGCHTYASDLNPVASILTWASLKIIGGEPEDISRIGDTQRRVFEAVDQQIMDWCIDSNSDGWRIDAMLYCTEVVDPETNWRVPLAPHWAIAPTSKVVAKLVPDYELKRYDIQLVSNASPELIAEAKDSGTYRDGSIVHPVAKELDKDACPIDLIRVAARDSESTSEYHESGLRLWGFNDLVPRQNDVFQERLYCIRWQETYYELRKGREREELGQTAAENLTDFEELITSGKLVKKTRRHFLAPTAKDLEREQKVLHLLEDRLDEWRSKGFVPTRSIVPGIKTSEPIRTRGWTYWHHLFTPRQLLTMGLLLETASRLCNETDERVACLLSVGRYADWNSKLCRWGTGAARESIGQTYSNQALNTLLTFASKGYSLSAGTWFMNMNAESINSPYSVTPSDCRAVESVCDFWITDPPYADAIMYDELTEYFLAWYEGQIKELFPGWYVDSKRQLAVRGNDQDFRKGMVDCYRRLSDKMPDDGLQVVMFTHQDASVWADLATILWASGLHVTSAWCIQTERPASGVREGNYVQGTVLMVLRKRVSNASVFLDEITHNVELEVRRQLDTMFSCDDQSDPNFGDADYQLAAYAAALRVITESPIEDIDPEKEINRLRPRGEISPIEDIIRNAVKIACDHLVPKNIDRDMWKTYSPMERFYLKGLEVETHGERRSGVYQELARGFGASDYDDLLANSKANETRLKTATEFAKKMLNGDAPFAGSLTRHVLYAVHTITKNGEVPSGLNWLKTELPNYWDVRTRAIVLLDFFAKLDAVAGMEHWKDDCNSARLLAGALRNDHG